MRVDLEVDLSRIETVRWTLTMPMGDNDEERETERLFRTRRTRLIANRNCFLAFPRISRVSTAFQRAFLH
jgi:hypothetical protein